jgi:hypothetical protein
VARTLDLATTLRKSHLDRMRSGGATALAMVFLTARWAAAQHVDVPGTVAAARHLVAAQQLDSAVTLLTQATNVQSGATVGDRAQAFILLGVVRYYQGMDSLAFRSALTLDTTLQVAGLAQIDSSLVHAFEIARVQALAATRRTDDEPHPCIPHCAAGESPPRLRDMPQLVFDSGPDFVNTHAVLIVRLVVGETGAPEPATIRIETSTMPKMNSQVLDVVRAAHFWPARAKGAPVRALIELRFDFRAEGMTGITYRVGSP